MSEVAILPADEQASALMNAPAMGAGVTALASMSDREFQSRMQALMQGQERLQILHRTLMRPEIDFGTIPGTPKPTLFKPGAERLCQFYRLAPEFVANVSYGDAVREPAVTVVCFCRLHVGDLDGPVVGMADGACSSWERKYRYRRGEQVCPQCGVSGALNRSKRDPEFYCWAKKGGCGATFPLNDTRITQQAVGDVENPDQYDLLNTVLKMAEKRAFVAAVLLVTATSSLYTQDVAEEPAARPEGQWEPAPRDEPPAPRQNGHAPPPARSQAPAPTGAHPGYKPNGQCLACFAPAGVKHVGQKCPLVGQVNNGGGSEPIKSAAAEPGKMWADESARKRKMGELAGLWQQVCAAHGYDGTSREFGYMCWAEWLGWETYDGSTPLTPEDLDTLLGKMRADLAEVETAGAMAAAIERDDATDPFIDETPAGKLFADPAPEPALAGHAR